MLLLWSLKDRLLCSEKPVRKWLITHSTVIVKRHALSSSLKGTLVSLIFPLAPFFPLPTSEHKMKMRSPLSADNFPGVKPIYCHWAVSNNQGRCYKGAHGCCIFTFVTFEISPDPRLFHNSIHTACKHFQSLSTCPPNIPKAEECHAFCVCIVNKSLYTSGKVQINVVFHRRDLDQKYLKR